MRGLYVHIPFCLKKCHYCNFVITTKRTEGFRARFFQALLKEIKQAREKYGRLCFDTLYLGGGTPSALTAEEMGPLIEALRRDFDFMAGHEITCEVNPGDVDRAKLETYRSLGINRISLGVQAFQDPLLKDMGRPHTVADTLETWRLLRDLGFNNISFDLINGLPSQTIEYFEDSLRKTIELEAEQLSLYDLDVHEKTVYGLRR
ncbi:MAG TPA: coproporphyrinogen-III oxidase family protein, partial [bacterium]|nr:coproporphyrinogen-III oxidase family protein [bacterium]